MLRWIERFPSSQLMSLHLSARHSLMRSPKLNGKSRRTGNRLEVKEGPDRRWIFVCANMKAQVLRDDLHGYVIGQHFRGHSA
jgi:hypothetical protein